MKAPTAEARSAASRAVQPRVAERWSASGPLAWVAKNLASASAAEGLRWPGQSGPSLQLDRGGGGEQPGFAAEIAGDEVGGHTGLPGDGTHTGAVVAVLGEVPPGNFDQTLPGPVGVAPTVRVRA